VVIAATGAGAGAADRAARIDAGIAGAGAADRAARIDAWAAHTFA
jgi:hypothetical protein